MSFKFRFFASLLTILLVSALDQWIKHAVLEGFRFEGDFIDIVLTFNTGVAFSIGRDFPLLLKYGLLILLFTFHALILLNINVMHKYGTESNIHKKTNEKDKKSIKIKINQSPPAAPPPSPPPPSTTPPPSPNDFYHQKLDIFNADFVIFLAFCCILGAGYSNLLDRFLHGGVVDYIFWHYGFKFAIFNFADALINLSVAIIIFAHFKKTA